MTPRHAVRLTAGAEADLSDIHRWMMREGGTETADGFLDRLLERIGSLERHPLRGPVPPELETVGVDAVRQASVDRYRLVYRVDGDQVTILLIAHGRRDLRDLLEQRLLRG